MNRLAPLILLFVISGCEKQSGAPDEVEIKAVSGIDTEGMNLEVRPQDDFYEYANGTWLANTEIPAEESGWGSYMTLRKQAQEQARAIVLELAETDADQEGRQIGDYYNAWMNEALVERLGATPLAEDLADIAGLGSHDEVASYFGKVNPIGVGAPINFFVGRDRKDSTQYTVYFLQTGLGLPDRDYYFDESDRGKEIVAGYKNYIITLLAFAGYEDPEGAADRILALETRLAEHQWDKVRNRDREKTYNPYDAAGFETLLSSFNVDAYLPELGFDVQAKTIVMQPSYFEAFNELFREVPVGTWQEYLRMRLLTSYANFLSNDFVEARFNMYSKLLYGREEMQPRWRRAINSVNGNLGELLGKFYVERHFSPEAKARMVVMVDNLMAAYGESIKSIDWMSAETKEKALTKLSKFNPKIGYPDKWKDYSDLEVIGDDLVGNIKRARSWSHFDNVSKLGQPIDKNEWFMAPQEVNAYYYASGNEIVFPAAYLQAPNFLPEAEDAYNYGAIGSTIGHEIGHGFDDQGSKYDGDGNMESWWTEEDRQQFEERTAGLVDQFNKFEPLPGLFINGELTLGENIGDLGGTAIALKAYKMSIDGGEGPEIDGFSAIERFFIGNAQASRLKWREQFLEMLVKTDPHSPDKYRVNAVLSNMDDFYKTYDVEEGDALYLPEEERISIW